MPQPTGIRALSRSFAIYSHPKKTAPPTVDPEKQDIILCSDIREQNPLRSTMDVFASKQKRNSLHLPGRGSPPAGSKGSPKGSPRIGPAKPAKLVVDMESPPIIFHGTSATSSGALLSGQLLLTVADPEITLSTFSMVLNAKVTTRKPVSKDCPECSTKTTELFNWRFLTEPTHYKKGQHNFPFSYLLPGHLPTTSHSDLGLVDYSLSAKAVTNVADTITVERPLIVQRALMPGPDKNSIRIFPPTHLTATLTLPPVIHPIGSFPVQMRITGLVDTSLKDIQRRWRIRKMSWRIDEQSRIISAACHKHAHKVGGEGKGILHDDTRTVGGEDFKSGWKTDFDTPGGQIEMEFTAAIKANSHPVCDVESPTGLSITHNLIMELIVAEEQTATKGGKYATPTGAARVLRMQFKLILTERAGMGISWDEEMPPMYEDVPSSPPHYQNMENFEGDLSHLPQDEELENMREQH